MSIDPQTRFTGLADTYRRHRPSYPHALLDWIVALFAPQHPRSALDVGCGTGISTRLLAARGIDVVGVDPNADMMRAAREQGPGRYVEGTSTRTGLADASVDLVTAAQSFHWFDVDATLAELRRILRPGGWCAAFWNQRADTPFHQEYRAALRRFSDEYERLPKVDAALDALRAAEGVSERREATFPNLQRFDLAGLLGRAHSSSYVHRGVADLASFDAELRRIFEHHARDGLVDFPYDCRVLAWRFERVDSPPRRT
jgi:ubiquinone/menaquinone biosynthesis C-methylase UbiE